MNLRAKKKVNLAKIKQKKTRRKSKSRELNMKMFKRKELLPEVLKNNLIAQKLMESFLLTIQISGIEQENILRNMS